MEGKLDALEKLVKEHGTALKGDFIKLLHGQEIVVGHNINISAYDGEVWVKVADTTKKAFFITKLSYKHNVKYKLYFYDGNRWYKIDWFSFNVHWGEITDILESMGIYLEE